MFIRLLIHFKEVRLMVEMQEKQKKRHHQEDLQRLQSFRPIDDTFMRCLFRNNVPLAEMVLRIITGKNDLQLVSCETQADLKRVTGARSILLDAYGTDSTGKKYDIEVQRADIGGRSSSGALSFEYDGY